MRDTGFTINEAFKTQLITGILSSPLLYIPHFHYSYIDQALHEVIYPEGDDNVLRLSKDSVFELVCGDNSRLDFETKRTMPDGLSLEGMLKTLIADSALEPDQQTFDVERIFLIKNSFSELESATTQRLLQTYAAKYERGEFPMETTVIFVSPEPMESLPQQVEKLFTVVEVPRPTEVEIMHYIERTLPCSAQFDYRKSELQIELTRALQGLQHYEVEQIIRSTKVRTGGYLTERTTAYALEEKKSIVKKSGIIEVVDTDVSFDQVGGLEILREDLRRKAELFKHLKEASDLRLPLPKGVLVLGMPGCGKSLIAKSIANEFGVSLLRLDINRLMGQYVGQSEANLRKALSTAEAAHPCVLWIDEIEKAFAGATGGGGGTNDIVMRLMGHFLTWMQERRTAVYIVATANDVMRPEFMRKGRFDEVYFVDFPTTSERLDILEKKLARYQQVTRQQEVFDLTAIGAAERRAIAEEMCGSGKASDSGKDGFSGSEIESVVNAVMERKFLEYLEQGDPAKRHKVRVEKKDFTREIKIIRPSVMSNQKGKKEGEKTSVERIRDLQSVYQFRSASKSNQSK